MQKRRRALPATLRPGAKPSRESTQNCSSRTRKSGSYILYGSKADPNYTKPTEWQIRSDAAAGDAEAQAILDQRLQEEGSLARTCKALTKKDEEDLRAATRGQLNQAEVRKNNAYRKLEDSNQLNLDTGDYDEQKFDKTAGVWQSTGRSISPEGFVEKKNQIERNYAAEVRNLTGNQVLAHRYGSPTASKKRVRWVARQGLHHFTI